MEDKLYDFLIIGAGVAGLASSMYSARLGLKTLCLGASHGKEMPIGGVITSTDVVENYPGFISLSGLELADKIKNHALSYDLVQINEEKVISIKKDKKLFIIKTEKETYMSKAILFATGTKWRKLPKTVKGSEKFENKGISYCSLCDGPLYKNKIVAVIGGSDSSIKDALVLKEHAKKVYIIYRGEQIHPEPINFQKVKKNKRIEVINKTNIIEIKGKNFVESVVLDKDYNVKKELKLDGIFVAIGHIVLSDLAKSIGVKLNKKNEIIINHKTSETNIKGVYAAGDVADKSFKQAITGVAEGCTAAYSAFNYISDLD